MLNWKLIVFVFFVFVLGNILCMTIEGSWFGSYEQSVMTDATAFDVPVYSGLWGTARTGVGIFTDALPKALSWNYVFLNGSGYDLLKYVLLYPISAGVIGGFFLAIFAGAVRLFRG